jgi:hypothetical protein
MRSAAMERRRERIDPGLYDTALPRYEERLSESMGEQCQKVDYSTPQRAWDNRAPTVLLKVDWL